MKSFRIKKSVVYFFLFALFLMIEITLGQYFKSKLNGDKISSDVEYFVTAQLHDLNVATEKMSSMDSVSLRNFINDKSLSLFSQQETEYLVYEKGSLKYWTDNRISVPAVYDLMLFDDKVEKFASAYCLVAETHIEDKRFVALSILKYNYPYENENLKNSFNKRLDVPTNVRIKPESGSYAVEQGNQVLFYLDVPADITLSENQNKLLFSLFMIALLFLFAGLYHGHKFLNPFPSRPRLFVLFYIIDIAIVRLLIAFFGFPVTVHNSMLFDPSIMAFSQWFPSLGDMFLTAISILAIMYAVFRDINFKLPIRNKFLGVLANFLVYIMLIITIKGMYWLIQSMVMDSSVMLNLHKVFSVDFYTITGFLTLFVFIAALYLFIIKMLRFVRNSSSFQQAVFALLLASAFYILFYLFLGQYNWVVSMAIVLLLFWFTCQKFLMGSMISARGLVFNLILFAALITFLFQHHNQKKEQEERQVGAVKIASRQDPVAESMFLDVEEEIFNDDTLMVLLNEQPLDEDLVISYVLFKYFSGYWDKYNFHATLCTPYDNLILRPNNYKQNCDLFFEQMISEMGKFTFSKNLFYLETDPWFPSYIGRLSFPRWPEQGKPPFTLYLELDAKFAPEGLVYPELLISDNIERSSLFSSEYSMAKYQNGELIASIGNYTYLLNSKGYPLNNRSEKHFFQHRGFSHLYYPISEGEVLLVSKYVPGFFESLAPFAYVLIFLALFLLLNAVIMKPDLFLRLNRNFKTRLQAVFFIVVLASFILIGILSIFYLRNLNEDKNRKLLKEKLHSILIEVEHKLSDYPELDPGMYPYVNDLMFKFASVFFTDINMYDTEGLLIATSRPEIYEEGLVSRQMNSDVLKTVKQKGKTIILHKEKLGDLEYSSAYMPFRNTTNEVIAYLNLPYFAKQSELENEITDFLATFINLYVILLAIAISLALLLTGYIARPLNLIKEQMRKVKLGASNEKIQWEDKDEIGELVSEYNKMIDELERSADLLMRSQRESAWREMAKQVAHEIKNPLTPMKLNIQMLQRSWDADVPDWEQKMKRVTDSLLEQIDNLAAIASEFSDFAKMPVSKPEVVNLEEVVNHSNDLYNNYDHVRISFANHAPHINVKADYKQMIRVFNNILDNAVQAIPKEEGGMIHVEINQKDDRLLVSIKDNGRGIPVEMQNKIFSPSFTTKSSGMGLGLTMVKSIVHNAGGKIWFESVENEGTTFFVELPQVND